MLNILYVGVDTPTKLPPQCSVSRRPGNLDR